MSLYLNSPSYYSIVHGIDDDVYKMCSLISKGITVGKYTTKLESIGITPIIAPEGEIKKGLYKEVKKISLTYGFAIVSLQIDYDQYVCSEVAGKKELILDNILESLKIVKKRLGVNFDYETIREDILYIVSNMS